MQAAIGYPLTVHGTGGLTRAFIHIRNTVECIRLAMENPPEDGQAVRIFNQTTETHRVRELAHIIGDVAGAEVAYVDNPRAEADENELAVKNEGLLGLGLEPVTLEQGLLEEVHQIAEGYADRCDVDRIPCRSVWNRNRPKDTAGTPIRTGEETSTREAAASS